MADKSTTLLFYSEGSSIGANLVKLEMIDEKEFSSSIEIKINSELERFGINYKNLSKVKADALALLSQYDLSVDVSNDKFKKILESQEKSDFLEKIKSRIEYFKLGNDKGLLAYRSFKLITKKYQEVLKIKKLADKIINLVLKGESVQEDKSLVRVKSYKGYVWFNGRGYFTVAPKDLIPNLINKIMDLEYYVTILRESGYRNQGSSSEELENPFDRIKQIAVPDNVKDSKWLEYCDYCKKVDNKWSIVFNGSKGTKKVTDKKGKVTVDQVIPPQKENVFEVVLYFLKALINPLEFKLSDIEGFKSKEAKELLSSLATAYRIMIEHRVYNYNKKTSKFLSTKVQIRNRVDRCFDYLQGLAASYEIQAIRSLIFWVLCSFEPSSKSLLFSNFDDTRKILPELNVAFNGTLKLRIKDGFLRFHSLQRWKKVLLSRELSLWGLSASASEENKIFKEIESLYSSKSLMFWTKLQNFNAAASEIVTSDTFKKYLLARSKIFKDVLSKNIKVNSIDRAGATSIKNLDFLEKYLYQEDYNLEKVVDPLSFLLALKGIYVDTQNAFFGNSLVKEKSITKKKTTGKDRAYCYYSIPDSKVRAIVNYYYSAHKLKVSSLPMDKLELYINEELKLSSGFLTLNDLLLQIQRIETEASIILRSDLFKLFPNVYTMYDK